MPDHGWSDSSDDEDPFERGKKDSGCAFQYGIRVAADVTQL
ncbi:hypothetical protein [Streptomyces sp. AcE210]|nr:hypothetical protein [Streptomyces sp. AcE210]